MTTVEHYFGSKAGVVWTVLEENGPLSAAALKRKTKLTDAELYGALGWLAKEGKLSIQGNLPLLFKFMLKK